MTLGSLKYLYPLLRMSPLHPQWLLARRHVPVELSVCRGIVVDVGAAGQWLRTRLDPDARYLALDLPLADGSTYGGQPDVFADAQALPLADDSVDAVVCFEVLEHVDDAVKAVTEATRVLRSGGYYFVSMPFMYPLHDRPSDLRRATPYGLSRSLADAGLEVLSVRRMMRAVETAGLLAALAVVGGLHGGGWRWSLLPLAAPTVLMINLGAWFLAHVWPDWDGMTMGYEAIARKP